MRYQQRRHRLSLDHYRGQVTAAFTLCTHANAAPFIDAGPVEAFTTFMRDALQKHHCLSPAFVFMPDHQHILVTGIDDEADTWRAIVLYKQLSGHWFSKYTVGVRWQRSFYDHVLRTESEIRPHVRYVLENPVRRGLVGSWREYPFKGALGCDLDDVLRGIMLVRRR